ncbi:MAG: FAD-dependent oxidoreductase, partial [Flavobacteriaceae bacterium]|nr:FAD-dependent oxidoreductase [Flavobacteriaceae bacterium]
MIKNLKILIAHLSAFLLMLSNFSCSNSNFDIIIVGGGTSGIASAIQSSRLGSKTLLIEESTWLGGMITSAGVSAMDGNYKMPSGFLKEFRDSLVSHYGHLDSLKTGWVSNLMFEPSVGNRILKDIAESEKNLKILYGTTIEEVVKDEKFKIKTKESTITYSSKILIDATELGDLIPKLNLPYFTGMDSSERFNEDIAPELSNDIIQDLTYVMILKDYGKAMTIKQPKNYNKNEFICSYNSGECNEKDKKLWSKEKLISYGQLPNKKYMINWPINGNDFYINSIELNDDQRFLNYEKAKEKSLRFLYFIQTEMGFSNLSIDYNEYPSKDGFPLMPYHRESRRSKGEVTLTLNDIKSPYMQENSLYRTGIAVGDYPVDHHHGAYSNYSNLPKLDFYPVPSYSVPLGSLIPKNIDNFIVIEKSISVSNLVNGTSRLQPVVLQIGQASGVLASLAILKKKNINQIKLREVQLEILKNGGYILPYVDVDSEDLNFISYQKIGACGILRSEGLNIGWENKTLFYPNHKLDKNDIYLDDWKMFKSEKIAFPEKMTIKNILHWIYKIKEEPSLNQINYYEVWKNLNLTDFDLERIIKRGEFSVLIDKIIDPFSKVDVDYYGNLIL